MPVRTEIAFLEIDIIEPVLVKRIVIASGARPVTDERNEIGVHLGHGGNDFGECTGACIAGIDIDVPVGIGKVRHHVHIEHEQNVHALIVCLFGKMVTPPQPLLLGGEGDEHDSDIGVGRREDPCRFHGDDRTGTVVIDTRSEGVRITVGVVRHRIIVASHNDHFVGINGPEFHRDDIPLHGPHKIERVELNDTVSELLELVEDVL